MILQKLNESAVPDGERPCGRLKCRWCGEVIEGGEDVVFDCEQEPMHVDCLLELANSSLRDFVRWLCAERFDVYNTVGEWIDGR